MHLFHDYKYIKAVNGTKESFSILGGTETERGVIVISRCECGKVKKKFIQGFDKKDFDK